MSLSNLEPRGSKVSQAFFAALIAAVQGKDELAAAILRDIADEVLGNFLAQYQKKPLGGEKKSAKKSKKK